MRRQNWPRNICVPFLMLFLLTPVVAQETHRRIGEIDFYGYAGLDLEKIRTALPVSEGDELANDAVMTQVAWIRETVKRVVGHPATDVAAVCCDAQGNWIFYIGLPGSSIRTLRFNPPPKGRARLPTSITAHYQKTMEASSSAVGKGVAAEDHSRGFALSVDPDLRAMQLATRAYALRNEALVRRVLASSEDAEQRIAAAHILGYARQSAQQIQALVRASQDSDETVRNNAIRALGVLAQSDPKGAARIPAQHFIAMLSSGSWTDRNKAGFLLDELTERRDPKLLAQLRSQSLDSLIEMARWRSRGHADFARILLGRIAGIEEVRLRALLEAGQVDQILEALK
jgi:HEAT repeats